MGTPLVEFKEVTKRFDSRTVLECNLASPEEINRLMEHEAKACNPDMGIRCNEGEIQIRLSDDCMSEGTMLQNINR